MTCLQRYGLTACAARILGHWYPSGSTPGASSAPFACHLRGRGNIPSSNMGMPDHLSRRWCSIATIRRRGQRDCLTFLHLTGDLPPPNWIVWRPANDHAHVCWTLAYPVHRYPEARIGPLRHLAYIAEYFAYAVGADPGYAGVLAHNPVLTRGTPYETVWGWKESRTLQQYAEVIPVGWKPPKVRQTGVGRTVALFEAGMQWAGREANAALPVLPALMLLNQNFTPPLPPSEVEAAAKSIEKYRKRWAAHGQHCPRWLAKQAARGRASGRARFEGSNEQRKPWEAEGFSRRTWYRRRAT